jgi:hypothetical protein
MLLLGALMYLPVCQSALINGGFDQGWNGWTGNRNFIDEDLTSGSDAFSLCSGQISSSGNCSGTGGGSGEHYAQLLLSPSNDDFYVSLYQEIDISVNDKWLEFDYLWDPSVVGADDAITAALYDPTTYALVADLFEPLSSQQEIRDNRHIRADVSSLQGQTLILEISLYDFDGIADTLQIDNLELVSEPLSLMLLGIGLAGFSVVQRKYTQRV